MQQKLQGSLSAPFKASPPVFGLHVAVQEGNTWSRSEEGRLACWTSPPHREATVNTDTVITATTLAAQEGNEMISTYHSYSGGYYSKVVRNNVSAQNASCAF